MEEPESCLKGSVGEYTADLCAHVIMISPYFDHSIEFVQSLVVPIF